MEYIIKSPDAGWCEIDIRTCENCGRYWPTPNMEMTEENEFFCPQCVADHKCYHCRKVTKDIVLVYVSELDSAIPLCPDCHTIQLLTN